jgi:hypothetical protein
MEHVPQQHVTGRASHARGGAVGGGWMAGDHVAPPCHNFCHNSFVTHIRLINHTVNLTVTISYNRGRYFFPLYP